MISLPNGHLSMASATIVDGVSAHSGDPPCEGLSVVELARGTSDLGLGLAGGVPGMVLAELGATVVRVVDDRPGTIDDHVAWGRVWHRHKQIVTTDDPAQIRELLRTADVALAYGAEAIVEGQGLGFHDVGPR